MALLTAGILSVSNPTEGKASPTITYEAPTSTKDKLWKVTSTTTKDGVCEITGKVVTSDDDTPVAGVNVVVKHTAHGTVTNADGNFKLTWPAGEKITLVFSFIGLVTAEQEVAVSQPTQDLGKISLDSDVTALGGECVTYSYRWYSPRRWWAGIVSIFR